MTAFLSELEREGINYALAHNRDEAIMVDVAVPGERWEIEFFADGSVEIERFVSNGQICDEGVLSELFARYAEKTAQDVEVVTAA